MVTLFKEIPIYSETRRLFSYPLLINYNRLLLVFICYYCRMSKRGSLIIFEGVDRCGKTTQVKIKWKSGRCSSCDTLSADFQVKLVNERLLSAGHNTFVTRFPERTSDIGQMINQYLKNNNDLSDQAVHLLFSANRWEYNSLIKGKYSSRIASRRF